METNLNENALIHGAFEHQVTCHPDKIALKFGEEHLTYSQLNGHANHLAKHLLAKGSKRGDTIALAMDRTPQMFIAILAVLKAGGAYLPLDVSSPLPRNLFCLNEAKVAIVITDRDCNDLVEDKRTIIETSDETLFNSSDSVNVEHAGDTDDKCYVMYTSGSTGTPKGVMVPHRGVIRLVKDTNYIHICHTDTFLQFAPLSFDASTFEIWGALLNGATLVLYSGVGLDPNLFAREIKDNNVTVLWLTAALFHMIATRYIDALSTVNTLLAGGDVLYPKVINTVLDEYPGITVINGYGPTENTTFTCCHRMTEFNRPNGTVPIGVAITGTHTHILDDHHNVCKPGEEGELFTSGLGVALGYMDTTKQGTFFHNEEIAPGMIYSTGDLVCENEHGEIEFRGRIDNQIKVRGYRVSLEEVQSNMLQLNKINEALVILHKFEGGDQQLVAYLQLQDDHGRSQACIKKELAVSLPKYMIPDLIHIDKELPICKNGKIDKKHASIAATTHAAYNNAKAINRKLSIHKG